MMCMPYGAARPVAIDPEASRHPCARRCAHLQRRLTDWLKAEAKRDLIEASERYAAAWA